MTKRISGIISTVLILAALVLLSACATTHDPRLPEASELVLKGQGISHEEALRLEEGRRLYMKECTECHWRKWPDEHNTDDWKRILKRHRGRVPLDDRKYADLADYIMRVSHCFQTRKCSLTPETSH